MRRFLPSPFVCAAIGLILFVGAAKLGLISHYGSDLPFSDQWAAEGDTVYRWYLGGALEWRFFFFPHGEHTPALTRIAALGLFALNDELWDARVGMYACVILYVLFALIVWRMCWEILAPYWRMRVLVPIALLLAMPCNHENFLWGFQTQFIFLLFFGVGQLWCTLKAERVTSAWWIGQLAGLCSLFSIASGWLASVTLIAIGAWRWWHGADRRWCLCTIAASAVLAGAGAWLLNRAYYTPGQAAAPLDFVKSLLFNLAWPGRSMWWAAVTCAPAVIFLWITRSRLAQGPVRLLAGLIVWCWLMAAAFAYGRGSSPGAVAVRYFDPLTVGLLANGVALAWLLENYAGSARWKKHLLASVWLVTLALHLGRENGPQKITADLGWGVRFHQDQRQSLNAFFVALDPVELETNAVVRQFFPHFQFTLDFLRDPLARLALPPSVCPPLALQVDPSRSLGLVEVRRSHRLTSHGARGYMIDGQNSGARLVTMPINASIAGLWRFQFMGKLVPGESEVYVENAKGNRLSSLDQESDSLGAWRTLNIPVEEGLLRVVVSVAPGARLEISEPVEVGRLSRYGPKIAGSWRILLGLGAGLLSLAIWLDRREARAVSGLPATVSS